LCHGRIRPKSATLTAFLTKDSDKNLVKISDKKGEKTIKTKYTVLSEKGDVSLVEIKLLTGRTHQIRAHMAHIGHSLLGDTKYGKASENKDYPFKFQALMSYKLEFNFLSDAGSLNYLNGKRIEVKDISFKREYFDLL
jgi:23S rRNA pseudouridine955/2504/2580 synthase